VVEGHGHVFPVELVSISQYYVPAAMKLRAHIAILQCAAPVTVFHLIRLTEIFDSIADHAENAGDMMRAMIAR
jgi:hypothetical protein